MSKDKDEMYERGIRDIEKHSIENRYNRIDIDQIQKQVQMQKIE